MQENSWDPLLTICSQSAVATFGAGNISDQEFSRPISDRRRQTLAIVSVADGLFCYGKVNVIIFMVYVCLCV